MNHDFSGPRSASDYIDDRRMTGLPPGTVITLRSCHCTSTHRTAGKVVECAYRGMVAVLPYIDENGRDDSCTTGTLRFSSHGGGTWQATRSRLGAITHTDLTDLPSTDKASQIVTVDMTAYRAGKAGGRA